ncbi:MAG TPA: hypothetical protein VFQ25_03980 [Ktedonobacterales bacterium]|nr:hypothetical protein [Ktedonobacterales bacterium]
MVARIAGGAAAGWLLSLAPLVVVNTLSLTSGVVDPSSTALAGVVALALGVALGGLAAGLIGGRRGGAIAGAVAGALFAASLIALMFALREQGNLPNLVALHPIRTMGALVFLGALVAGVALVTALIGQRDGPVAPRSASAPRGQVSGPRQPGPTWQGPQSGPVRGQSQPRPDLGELAPARRMDAGWAPDPRRAPPGSGPRQARLAPSQPVRRPPAAPYDERGRRPDAPGRW